MSREREVHKEKDFWGNEKEVIYENGEKVGELRLEERGGFFGLGAETVKVEYGTDRKEVGYTKQEERGGCLGFGAEVVEVRYNTKDEEEGYSRVEETGGFLGLGTHHVRAEYDTEGNKVSQTNWEKRGDILGLGGERVRVTRFSANQSAQAISAAGESEGSTSYSSASSDYTSPGGSTKSSGGPLWGAIIVIALIVIALLSRESIWDSVALTETERNAKHLPEVANTPSVPSGAPTFGKDEVPVATPTLPEPNDMHFIVMVDSVPPGATVYIDSEQVGTTPLNVALLGKDRDGMTIPYGMKIEKKGYQLIIRQIDEDGQKNIHVELLPE